MSRRNKITQRVQIRGGREIKAWLNMKTGTMLPTHWKHQSSVLALLIRGKAAVQ